MSKLTKVLCPFCREQSDAAPTDHANIIRIYCDTEDCCEGEYSHAAYKHLSPWQNGNGMFKSEADNAAKSGKIFRFTMTDGILEKTSVCRDPLPDKPLSALTLKRFGL